MNLNRHILSEMQVQRLTLYKQKKGGLTPLRNMLSIFMRVRKKFDFSRTRHYITPS